MELHDHPLFEFDPEHTALINPRRRTVQGFPTCAVVCWFGDVVRARQADRAVVHRVPFEHGAHGITIVEEGGLAPVALVNAPVGAPAAVSTLEHLLALGATDVIGCGGAGVIVSGFDVGHVIVPTSAVRDEGTSYHYVPAGEEVGPHPDALAAIVHTLSHEGVPFELGRVWTTDAFFRETPAKIQRRREQGCVAVDMEASAMFAVARFRGARYGQLLYAGDDVSAAEWDHRGWDRDEPVRERVLDLAFMAARRLSSIDVA